MAETEPPAGGEGKSGSPFGFLGHKLFGKVPVWVVAAGLIGAYYWYTKYGPGKKAGAQSQTDPAGNTGTIDPETGFVYGSPEDLAVLAGSSGTSSAGNYQDWQDQQQSGSGGGTVAPQGTPVTGTIPMGPGEGPVPGPKPVRQPVIPGVGSLGEGQVPRPKPRTVPKRGTAGPPPVRNLVIRPKAS